MTDDTKPSAPAPWEELAAWAKSATPVPEPAPASVTWQELLGSAIAVGLFGVGVVFLARACAEQKAKPPKERRRRPAARQVDPLDPEVEAAALLGVPVDASCDEIRAAFRRRFVDERLHPDQGGDEEAAKRLTAAKNLLFDRRRGRR